MMNVTRLTIIECKDNDTNIAVPCIELQLLKNDILNVQFGMKIIMCLEIPEYVIHTLVCEIRIDQIDPTWSVTKWKNETEVTTDELNPCTDVNNCGTKWTRDVTCVNDNNVIVDSNLCPMPIPKSSIKCEKTGIWIPTYENSICTTYSQTELKCGKGTEMPTDAICSIPICGCGEKPDITTFPAKDCYKLCTFGTYKYWNCSIGDKQLNVYTTDVSVEQNVQTYKYRLYTPYTTDDTPVFTLTWYVNNNPSHDPKIAQLTKIDVNPKSVTATNFFGKDVFFIGYEYYTDTCTYPFQNTDKQNVLVLKPYIV